MIPITDIRRVDRVIRSGNVGTEGNPKVICRSSDGTTHDLLIRLDLLWFHPTHNGIRVTSFIEGLVTAQGSVRIEDNRTVSCSRGHRIRERPLCMTKYGHRKCYQYRSAPGDPIVRGYWLYGYAWVTKQWDRIPLQMLKVRPECRAAAFENTARYYWENPEKRNDLRVIL